MNHMPKGEGLVAGLHRKSVPARILLWLHSTLHPSLMRDSGHHDKVPVLSYRGTEYLQERSFIDMRRCFTLAVCAFLHSFSGTGYLLPARGRNCLSLRDNSRPSARPCLDLRVPFDQYLLILFVELKSGKGQGLKPQSPYPVAEARGIRRAKALSVKWFVLAFVFLSLAACGGQQNNQPVNSTPVVHQPVSQTSVPPITHHHKVGETVDASGWTITLNSVHTQASYMTGNYELKPTHDGYVFLAVAITARNILSKEQFLDSYQFVLRDTDGNQYVPNYGVPDNNIGGNVEAGAPLKGGLVYEVPPTVHQYVLRFTPVVTDVIPPTVIWDLKVS